MLSDRICRAAQTAAIAASFVFIFAIVALAQDRRQNAPGEFDFYVLALSWSPSYCESVKERTGSSSRPDPQCSGRPIAFVVHGLWPQYDQGFPSFCQMPAPRLNREIVGANLDLMPSPRLIFREWDRHGTCSGLSAHAYFDAVRKARAVVKVPPEFLTPAEFGVGVARRHRRGFHAGQFGPVAPRPRRRLRLEPADGNPSVHDEGFRVPRLRRRRQPRLLPRQDRDARSACGHERNEIISARARTGFYKRIKPPLTLRTNVIVASRIPPTCR